MANLDLPRPRPFSVAVLLVLLPVFGLLASGQEPGDSEPRRLRTFGGPPPWASESWAMRRQLEQPWALTGARLVDVRSGEIREGVNIVVVGDVIRSVGTEPLAPGIEAVDVSGKYVIPGMFDLHAHVMPRSIFFPRAKGPEETLEILLDHGITTIRALPLYAESGLRWAALVNSGQLAGPTIVTASTIFEQRAQRTSRGFGDAATAERWVRKEALLGSRWIKVYNAMDEESLQAIVETARAYGMKVCGHTEEVPPLEAARLGIGSIEHTISIPLSCMTEGTRLPPAKSLVDRAAMRWEAVDRQRAIDLMDSLAECGVAWVPTLVVAERMRLLGKHDGVGPPEQALEEMRDSLASGLRTAAELAVYLHSIGGLVGTGTDFPIDGIAPGASPHRELELFVDLGGATPLEALQIATLQSARILGFEAILGTVEVGNIADLVVLTADPLADVSNVRQIEFVVHQGRRRKPR